MLKYCVSVASERDAPSSDENIDGVSMRISDLAATGEGRRSSGVQGGSGRCAVVFAPESLSAAGVMLR